MYVIMFNYLWHNIITKIALSWSFHSAGSATRQDVNYCQPCLPGCCHMYVEWPAFTCHVCWVVVHIPPATEGASVLEVISQTYFWIFNWPSWTSADFLQFT